MFRLGIDELTSKDAVISWFLVMRKKMTIQLKRTGDFFSKRASNNLLREIITQFEWKFIQHAQNQYRNTLRHAQCSTKDERKYNVKFSENSLARRINTRDTLCHFYAGDPSSTLSSQLNANERDLESRDVSFPFPFLVNAASMRTSATSVSNRELISNGTRLVSDNW